MLGFPLPVISQTITGTFSFRIPQVLRSNASFEPDWRRLDHSRNPLVESRPANATEQPAGNASLAMNETFCGRTIKTKLVVAKAPVSMRVNSESVSNESDESEKHLKNILNK
jgi:hypothetical protein